MNEVLVGKLVAVHVFLADFFEHVREQAIVLVRVVSSAKPGRNKK